MAHKGAATPPPRGRIWVRAAGASRGRFTGSGSLRGTESERPIPRRQPGHKPSTHPGPASRAPHCGQRFPLAGCASDMRA